MVGMRVISCPHYSPMTIRCFVSLAVNTTSVHLSAMRRLRFSFLLKINLLKQQVFGMVPHTTLRSSRVFMIILIPQILMTLKWIKIDIFNSFNTTCRTLTLDVLCGYASRCDYACALKQKDSLKLLNPHVRPYPTCSLKLLNPHVWPYPTCLVTFSLSLFHILTIVKMQSLTNSSERLWSRCWKILWEVGTVIWRKTLCVCDHVAGKYYEKWTRLFVVRLDPGLARRRHCLGHLWLLKRNKRNSLLVVLRYPRATHSTSVLNVPLFTTHVLLCLLWQSSPYCGILMQFTYSLTLPPLLNCWRGLLIDTHDTSRALVEWSLDFFITTKYSSIHLYTAPL